MPAKKVFVSQTSKNHGHGNIICHPGKITSVVYG